MMCPNCLALEDDPTYPHPTLRWALPEFDPTTTEALGSQLYEVCTACAERWFETRSLHRKPAAKRSR